jgi:hypothetical protein
MSFPAHSEYATKPIHSSTSVSLQNRFEVVQSTLAAKWTFRVDRVCGQVSQLVSDENEELNWQPMLIRSLPKCVSDGKSRYQLFTSGLAARQTFLINTDSGDTWKIKSITNDKGSESTAWFKFAK